MTRNWEDITNGRGSICVFVTVMLGTAGIRWAQSEPVVVLKDGGIEFSDGTVQAKSASGTPTQVAQTGQKTSGATNDDGHLRMGARPPYPRFTDNGDGTVTDNLTGLVWLEDADCLGTGDFSTALSQVASLNLGTEHSCAGYTAGTFNDWRLPSILELESLVDRDFDQPALADTAGIEKWSEGDAFSGVQSHVYWSSTASADPVNDEVWFINIFSGYTSNTGVAKFSPNILPAQPRWVSSICPTFIREGTPRGLRMISTGDPSGRCGMSSSGTILAITPLLPCRPAILSPTESLRFMAT